MIKLTCSTFMPSNELNFLNKFFHIKMPKDSSVKYYEDNKDYKKKLVKDIKVSLK